VLTRFVAFRSLTALCLHASALCAELNCDKTSGTAFKICATIVVSVNVLPNSFIMIIVTAVILTHRGCTSLLVSHRGHSRPLTAPPRSVHAGRSPAPRAGARGGSEGEGVNCLAPLSRASSRGQTRAEVNMGARPSTWEEPRRRAWSAIAMGKARRGARAHPPCLRSLRPSWNALFRLFHFFRPTGEDWGVGAGERASATVQMASNHPGRGGSRSGGASRRFVKA